MADSLTMCSLNKFKYPMARTFLEHKDSSENPILVLSLPYLLKIGIETFIFICLI